MSLQKNLVLLKLGGSLITNKMIISTALPQVISRIAKEIKSAQEKNPDLQILLGHGSGSFGHTAAKAHGTKEGVSSKEEWRGFNEVWHQASALNRIVIDSFHDKGIPAISFPASSSTITENGKIRDWNIPPIKKALDEDIFPIVFGDVVFDKEIRGTIVSTEDIFSYFAEKLRPQRILLAGLDEGVFWDYPICEKLIKEINPKNIKEIRPSLGGSAATDVTGGMTSKVEEMLSLVGKVEGLEVQIFSGKENNSVKDALLGKDLGTKITSGTK